MDGNVLQCAESFKYLGSTIAAEGSKEMEITRRFQTGWTNWRDVSEVLSDRRMPGKLKRKVYRA